VILQQQRVRPAATGLWWGTQRQLQQQLLELHFLLPALLLLPAPAPLQLMQEACGCCQLLQLLLPLPQQQRRLA
jgi:hypothetical protein